MADKDSRLHVTFLNGLEIVFLSSKGQCLAKVGDGAAELGVALGQHARLRAHGDNRPVSGHTPFLPAAVTAHPGRGSIPPSIPRAVVTFFLQWKGRGPSSVPPPLSERLL